MSVVSCQTKVVPNYCRVFKMEEFLHEIRKIIPCRDTQLQELYDLFGEDDEPLPYCLFISGNTATGKTTCVDTVLDYNGFKHVTVNCAECYSQRIIYETILNGLKGKNRIDLSLKCDSLMNFIHSLDQIKTNRYEPVVIVLDKVEKLKSIDQMVLSTFMRLKEFCDLNICVVLVTDLIYEHFHFKMGVREPIMMYFPNYTKEELFKIIFLNHESFVDYVINHSSVPPELLADLKAPELFGNFLNAFLSVFFSPCRDLIELRHMARINFVKYCEPIIKGEIKSNDLTKLWRHMSPILKNSLDMLYLRINTAPDSEPTSPGKENYNPTSEKGNIMRTIAEKTLTDELTSTKTFAQSFELPYYAKYLLIAAYLASYNPAKEDKRLFMKYHGKQRKRMQQVKAKAKLNEKLNTQLGPKTFTLDRLLAIFYAILEEKIGLTSNLLSQIATLVELRLLSSANEIELDSSKYKCIVGYDFITAVSQTVGFNIRKYLYDFI